MTLRGPKSSTQSSTAHTALSYTEYNMAVLSTSDKQTFTKVNTFSNTGLSATALNAEGYPTITNTISTSGGFSTITRTSGPTMAVLSNTTSGVQAGIGVAGNIVGDNVYNAVWNDLVDCIEVPESTKLDFGYCYCFDGEKYHKSTKYLDDGIIGIHSDTAGFCMGSKPGTTQLLAAVAGFALVYVDKEYPVGTPLTCTSEGYLTEMKEEDIPKNSHKIVGTFWKKEWNSWWGFGIPSNEHLFVNVNNRMWIKVR